MKGEEELINMEIKSYTIKLKPIKVVSRKRNDFGYGLKRKRDLTLREARHILRNILGINISNREDFESGSEYYWYNEDILRTVQEWIDGNADDNAIMEYAYDCSDEPIGLFNAFRLASYLQKKEII